jgi:hypothetical protein
MSEEREIYILDEDGQIKPAKEPLKACWHCGSANVETEDESGWLYCIDCGNGLCDKSQTELVEWWNSRPIEDALAARIAELVAENEKLSFDLGCALLAEAKVDDVAKDLTDERDKYYAQAKALEGVIKAMWPVFSSAMGYAEHGKSSELRALQANWMAIQHIGFDTTLLLSIIDEPKEADDGRRS